MKFSPLHLLIVFATLLGAGAFGLGINPSTVKAQAPALYLPSSQCGTDTANVTFSWTPVAGAIDQWVDISIFDNGFAPGTFIGAQAGGSGSSFTWTGILMNLPHVYRVNVLTASGWVASGTGAFVACGSPFPLAASPSCQSRYQADVNFRWAPTTPAPVVQYLDLGYDEFFAPGSFYGLQVNNAASAYNWPNIPANLTQYFRINSLGADGVWRTSPTGSFTAACVPSGYPEVYLGDRLVIPAIGVDTEVYGSSVLGDGSMPDPSGYFHATWYDFSAYGTRGGYANVGNLVLAGHVDCAYCYGGGGGSVVFGQVPNLQYGDIARYYTADGQVITYAVVLSQAFDPNTDWNPVVHAAAADMTLITCIGNFAGGEYSLRHVVGLRKI